MTEYRNHRERYTPMADRSELVKVHICPKRHLPPSIGPDLQTGPPRTPPSIRQSGSRTHAPPPSPYRTHEHEKTGDCRPVAQASEPGCCALRKECLAYPMPDAGYLHEIWAIPGLACRPGLFCLPVSYLVYLYTSLFWLLFPSRRCRIIFVLFNVCCIC